MQHKTVKVEDAVGMILAHDITEIRPGEFKGAAFRKGYKVRSSDINHLKRLGKRNLYILNIDKDHVHENDAVLEIAKALSGTGIVFDKDPKEGKLSLHAEYDGLFKVDVARLVEMNMIQEVMCASIHNNMPVVKGKEVAGTRSIPLVIKKSILDDALDIAGSKGPIFSVIPFKPFTAHLIITGSEIHEGLIEDKFENVIDKKLKYYGSSLKYSVVLPDDERLIAKQIESSLENGADLIIATGGMSVDPDDVTQLGVRLAGADRVYYGAAVLPGAMFLLAYHKDVPIVGIPACGLFHESTIFDLVLPRLLAGEQPDNRDLAKFAHGGLCHSCDVCRYPQCAFGKTG